MSGARERSRHRLPLGSTELEGGAGSRHLPRGGTLRQCGDLNAALLLGDAATFSDEELRYISDEAVRVFLAAYGREVGVSRRG